MYKHLYCYCLVNIVENKVLQTQKVNFSFKSIYQFTTIHDKTSQKLKFQAILKFFIDDHTDVASFHFALTGSNLAFSK